MKLETLDTSKFLYDPKDDRSYRGLMKYKEFKKSTWGIPLYKVIQWIILMYDPANEVIEQEFPHLQQRKVSVANMVYLIDGKNIHPAFAIKIPVP